VRAVGVAVWPVSKAWRTPSAAPLRRWTRETSTATAREGHELVTRSRRGAGAAGRAMMRRAGDQLRSGGLLDDAVDQLLGSGAIDRLVAAIVSHPATDALLSRILEDPGLDRLIARVWTAAWSMS
jgi:hypothetical protein